jgi:hypothetical protein
MKSVMKYAVLAAIVEFPLSGMGENITNLKQKKRQLSSEADALAKQNLILSIQFEDLLAVRSQYYDLYQQKVKAYNGAFQLMTEAAKAWTDFKEALTKESHELLMETIKNSFDDMEKSLKEDLAYAGTESMNTTVKLWKSVLSNAFNPLKSEATGGLMFTIENVEDYTERQKESTEAVMKAANLYKKDALVPLTSDEIINILDSAGVAEAVSLVEPIEDLVESIEAFNTAFAASKKSNEALKKGFQELAQ